MKTKKPALWSLIIATVATAVCAEPMPVPVIFDTDITGDVDDVLALAMLHTLADRGACDLLAVTISKEHELAPAFVDAVNTFYGRPDVPVGDVENGRPRESKYLSLVEKRDREGGAFRYPHDLGVTAEPEKAVPLLRRTLESAKDRSVVIVQVGLATNLAQLLESEGGKALIRKKVKLLSIMAGSFQSIHDGNRYLEANVINAIPEMQLLAREWPDEVPVIWSGFEIGIAAPYPRESIAADFGYVPHHIVKEAYLLHSGPGHDRPTWDLTSVLFAVSPGRGYFDLSKPGRVTVEDDGFTRFDVAGGKRADDPKDLAEAPTAARRDRFLKMNAVQAARVQEALVHLVARPPDG